MCSRSPKLFTRATERLYWIDFRSRTLAAAFSDPCAREEGSLRLLRRAHQQHGDADLQQDPDDNDDVAVHEEHRAVVERPWDWQEEGGGGDRDEGEQRAREQRPAQKGGGGGGGSWGNGAAARAQDVEAALIFKTCVVSFGCTT